MRPPCHLASRSPRRLELLRAVGLDPLPCPVEIDESPRPGEPALALAARLAREKATAARVARRDDGTAGWLLAADTLVIVDGVALGKPLDDDEARSMLSRLSGRSHEVITGVHVMRTDIDRATAEVRTTVVRFRKLDPRTISRYVATGECRDKAGAYGIQGRGALLVEGIEGSWANVVGLPVERVARWIEAVALDPATVLGW